MEDTSAARKQEAEKLELAYYERRGHKVYIRINNPSSAQFDQFLFRVVVHDASDRLIEDISTIAYCPTGSGAAGECLLQIHDETEKNAVTDPAHSINVQLLHTVDYC